MGGGIVDEILGVLGIVIVATTLLLDLIYDQVGRVLAQLPHSWSPVRVCLGAMSSTIISIQAKSWLRNDSSESPDLPRVQDTPGETCREVRHAEATGVALWIVL